MTLTQSYRYAAKIKEWIAPFSARDEIAGSIRRDRLICNDVDIVCIPKIKSGEKPFTLRVPRKDKREPEPNSILYMHTGQRTKYCECFDVKTCHFCWPVIMLYGWISIGGSPMVTLVLPHQLERFARLDGFESYSAFCQFHEIRDGGKFKHLFIIGWTDWRVLSRVLEKI